MPPNERVIAEPTAGTDTRVWMIEVGCLALLPGVVTGAFQGCLHYVLTCSVVGRLFVIYGSTATTVVISPPYHWLLLRLFSFYTPSTDPSLLLPASPAQLQSIQGGNQAASDWQEEQGAVGGRPVVGMTSTTPNDSTKKSTDLQMQEQQFCSDVVSSPSAGGRSCAEERHFDKKIDEDLVRGIGKTKSFSNLILRYCTIDKDSQLWRHLCICQVQIIDLKLDYTDLRDHTTKESTWFPKFLVLCHIERLSLMSCQLSPASIAVIVKGIITCERKFVKLRSIVLMHNDIETEGLQEIAKLVNFLGEMDEVDLTNCSLTDSSLEKFKDSLEDGKEIHVLNVSQNFAFSPAGMTPLATIAMKCQTGKLLITSCGLEDEHIDRLASSLQNVPVKCLDLSRNTNISEDNYVNLVDKCDELKTIYLHKCGHEKEEENELKGKLRTGVKVEFESVMHPG